jgi:carbamoyl-phosphate synthase small subunit
VSRGKPAILALADGRVFRGCSFGAEGTTTGEAVFNTSMSGYQEILTDPSYHGQMVVMTYPQIGNYGVNPEDVESGRPWVRAFIVKELSPVASSWRSRQSLSEYLLEHGVIGLEGIDTRALVRHIRDAGAQIGAVSTELTEPASLIDLARRAPEIVGRRRDSPTSGERRRRTFSRAGDRCRQKSAGPGDSARSWRTISGSSATSFASWRIGIWRSRSFPPRPPPGRCWR